MAEIDNKIPAQNTGSKIKEAKKKPIVQTSAGFSSAAAWAYTTTAFELLQDLDASIASLANVDFTKAPSCKDVSTEEKKALEKFGKDFVDGLVGCAPFTKSIVDAVEEDSFENVTKAIISTTDALLSVGKKPFPKCIEPQIRRFISAIPVQYYLLVVLGKLAQQVSDFDTIQKQI